MIATPRFVFLHLHKSGGTFVNECLLRFVPGARQLGYHLPRKLIPLPYTALPVIGFVRSPWSYYVSWYSFQSARPQPNALFRLLSRGGQLDFAGTIRNMLSLGADGALLDAVVEALPGAHTNRGLNLPGAELAAIRGTGLGFYAFLFRYLFGEGGDLRIGRMEHLRTELLDLLASTGEPVPEPLRTHVASAAPTNTSAHAAYAGYYDRGLRELVAERDEMVIRRFGYRVVD